MLLFLLELPRIIIQLMFRLIVVEMLEGGVIGNYRNRCYRWRNSPIISRGKIQDELKKAVLVSPMVWWDMVKACVRRESIRYVKWDGIADKIKNEEFQARIANLYFLRDTSPSIESGAIHALIEKTSKEWDSFLEEIKSKRIAYSIGRKRQQDQKSSKYFFHKFNAIPGSTTQIYDPQGTLCTEDKDILEVCRSYYNKLFNKADVPGDSPYAFIPEPHTPLLLMILNANF